MLGLVIVFFVCLPVVSLLVFAAIRKINNPEKDFKHAMIQVGLTPMRYFRLGPFKAGELSLEKSLKAAVRKGKVGDDFGDRQFIENYRLIMNTESYKSQKLTNIGYLSASIELIMTWVRRLKFVAYLKKHPAVLNTPVRSPVFVTGLPRTGTTFLHRLLALDPAIRAPLLWELLNPVPSVEPDADEAAKERDLNIRAKYIRKLVNQRKELGDHCLTHIHEVDPDLPEECLMAMTDEVPVNLQFLYSNYMNEETFLTIDMTPCYKHYRTLLQLLSFQSKDAANPRRWMLKCPMHMFYTKNIAAAFPDAKIIWTHRHPISAVPSMCSLLKAVHQIYFEKEGRDDNELGKKLKIASANILERAPQDIKESGLPCHHVTYNSLIADPIATVKGVYADFGWEFTPEYEAILNQYLEENKKDREQRAQGNEVLHTYHPSEFGLTEEELCEGKYADYIKKFNVPLSRN